jgi:hypothetical protein
MTQLKFIVSLVFDDIRTYDNCPYLTRRLHDALRKRFDEITTTDNIVMFAGIEQDFCYSRKHSCYW